jgi:Tfp pilus assembly protein FimT
MKLTMQKKSVTARTICRREINLDRVHSGFSFPELMLVLFFILAVSAFAVPTISTMVQAMRSGGDARDLSDEVSLAKMRAAASFSQSRIHADLSAQTFVAELKGAGGWATDTGSAVLPLSRKVQFGFGSFSSSPSGVTIAQAPACVDNAGSAMSDTACILFNSRGIPVDSFGASKASGLYITDGYTVYGVTVSATGNIQTWRGDLSSYTWSIR